MRLEAFRRGRAFATIGPLLEFAVDGQGPGAAIRNRKRVTVRAEAVSRVRFDRLEVAHDSEVIAESTGSSESAAVDGWPGKFETHMAPRHTAGNLSCAASHPATPCVRR